MILRNIALNLGISIVLILCIAGAVFSAPYKNGLSGMFDVPDTTTLGNGAFLYNVWAEYYKQDRTDNFNVSPITVSFGVLDNLEVMIGAVHYNKYQLLYEKNSIGMIAGAKWRYLQNPDLATSVIGDNISGHPSVDIREVIEKRFNKLNLTFSTGYLSVLRALILSGGIIYSAGEQWDILFDTDNWIVNSTGFKNRFEGTAGARYYFANRSTVLSGGIGGGMSYTGKGEMHIILGLSVCSSSQSLNNVKIVEATEPTTQPNNQPNTVKQKAFESPVPEFKMRIPIQPIPDENTSKIK